jgi:PAS domain S-box-containing protein
MKIYYSILYNSNWRFFFMSELLDPEQNFEIIRSVFENSSDAILITKTDGTILEVNFTAEKMFNMTQEEFKTAGRDGILVQDENLKLAQEEPGKIGRVRVELTFKRKNGTSFPGEVTSNFFKDRNGNNRIYMVIRDISKLKKAEKELVEAEKRYHLVADFTYDWEEWYDAKRRLEYVSPSCERISGYSAQKFINNPNLIFSIVHPDDQKLFKKHYDVDFYNQNPDSIKFRIISSDKKIRWIEHFCQPVYDNEGQFMGRRASNRDITERKIAEKELYESEERYRSILNNVQDGYIRVDEKGTIIMVSPSTTRMYGYDSSQEMIGLSAFSLYKSREDRAKILDILQKREKVVDYETFALRKDGTYFPVSMNAQFHYNDQGQIQGTEAFVRDITERKIAEQQIKHHSLLLSKVTDAILGTDTDFNINYWNKAAEQMFGYTETETLGKTPTEVLRPNYNPGQREKIIDELEHQGTSRVTISTRNRNGTEVIAETNSTRIIDESGSTLGYVVVYHDITKRQKADEELKHINIELSEITADLQTILDIAPIVIWIANDPGCNNITGNAYADKIMHVHRGANISLSAPIEDQTVSYKVFQEGIELNSDELPAQVAAATGKKVEETELDLVFSDNRIVKLLLSAVPLFDNDGKVRGAITAGIDITNYKLIEDSLRESEERLRLAQTRGNVGVWDWNTITDELSFTPELEHLYGLSPGTIKTYQDWRQLTHPDDIEKVEAERDNKIANHEPFDLEFRIIHKSGDTRWLSARGGAIYDKEGTVVRVLGINNDITKRKLAEEELKLRSEELIKSNADLKQFAYVASHDLREPLRMITSFLQLLERRYKDQLDQDANEFISFAVDGAQRLDNMIMDLLEYSRIANQKIQFTDVNIQEIVDMVISNLKVLIDENRAQITYGSLPIIRGDENQMVRLFQNLIENSIKYRSVETPKIHFSSKKEGHIFVISIKDNGIGIDPKHLERIFTIFKRLHPYEVYEGTGIGLAVAQRIVHQHGGEIWAESQLDKGTTFYISIPETKNT